MGDKSIFAATSLNLPSVRAASISDIVAQCVCFPPQLALAWGIEGAWERQQSPVLSAQMGAAPGGRRRAFWGASSIDPPICDEKPGRRLPLRIFSTGATALVVIHASVGVALQIKYERKIRIAPLSASFLKSGQDNAGGSGVVSSRRNAPWHCNSARSVQRNASRSTA